MGTGLRVGLRVIKKWGAWGSEARGVGEGKLGLWKWKVLEKEKKGI